MEKAEAIEELKLNINGKHGHAVLLQGDDGCWYTELHAGHAGNCCCNQRRDFVWREESPYTDPEELDGI
jgi:hypothetical protein